MDLIKTEDSVYYSHDMEEELWKSEVMTWTKKTAIGRYW